MSREKGGFWVSVAAACFYPLSWLGRREYRGAERIPADGGVLLVMNHISHLDPPNDAVFVHRNKRVPLFMAKDGLFTVPLFGRVLAGAGGIPVYRDSASCARSSLEVAHQALADGKLVVIYPEGSITRDPAEWPMSARTGVARLALEHDVPVLPAARWGTQRIWNGYTKRFRPFPRKRVVTSVGEPVDLSGYRGKPVTNALLREVTELLMHRVADLLAEIRDSPAPAEFYRPHGRSTQDGGAGSAGSAVETDGTGG